MFVQALKSLMIPKTRRKCALLGRSALALGAAIVSTACTSVPVNLSLTNAPPSTPLLRLETGKHIATVNSIATDRHGRWAVTASDDKTARIWDVKNAELLRVMRPPQDDGHDGKLFAVSISPDGDIVAVGGWTGINWDNKNASIYLFARESGRLLRRIAGLPHGICHLAWSPDGRWLAASLGGSKGVRIFDPVGGNELDGDSDYQDDACSVEFSPTGTEKPRLVSSSFDGRVRQYSVSKDGRLRRIEVRYFEKGARPHAARYSPDGKMIAIGFEGNPIVQILSADSLSDAMQLEPVEDGEGDLRQVAWSSDGKSLAAAGSWRTGNKRGLVRWSTFSGQRIDGQPLADNDITDLVALPKEAGDSLIFSSEEPSWGVLNEAGSVRISKKAVPAIKMKQHDGIKISKDSLSMRFHYIDRDEEETIDPLNPDHLSQKNHGSFMPPRWIAPEIKLENWKKSTNPILNGKPLVLDRHERVGGFAILPDGRHFVLGTNLHLRLFNQKGQQIALQAVPSAVWSINVSFDGKWLIAGYEDGTIRWHRSETAQEVLAFFPHADRTRWVLWTPEGFYAAPEKSEDLIGYILNLGKDKEGEFVSAHQLRELFFNPTLVSARLSPDGDRQMDKAAHKIGSVRSLLTNASNLAPSIELLSPNSVEGESDVTLEFRIIDRGGGIGALKFYVDGQPTKARHTGPSIGQNLTQKFPLKQGKQVIEIAATSTGGVEGGRQRVTAEISGPKLAGTLHILSIGIESYEDKSLELENSAQDAIQVAAELEKRSKSLFARVAKPIVLLNKDASLTRIHAAFSEMHEVMKPDDTMVIFLAGHGHEELGKYRFLPWDFKKGAIGAKGEGLNESQLFDILEKSPAKTLLLIDSCNAGGMVESLAGAYARIGNITQRAIIGAARRGELAREGYEGHGVFTAALLQSLRQSANGRQLIVPGLYADIDHWVTEISSKMKGYEQKVSGFLGKANFPLVIR